MGSVGQLASMGFLGYLTAYVVSVNSRFFLWVSS